MGVKTAIGIEKPENIISQDELMDLTRFSPAQQAPHEKLTWGSATALWNLCRYKVVGLPMLDIFYLQAGDKELKFLIQFGINHILLPHVQKIQTFFQKEGLTAPEVQQRKTLKNILGHIEPNALISDELIARAMREVLRFGVELGARGLTEAIRADVRALILQILNDDNKALNKLVDLKEKKNWILMPPSV